MELLEELLMELEKRITRDLLEVFSNKTTGGTLRGTPGELLQEISETIPGGNPENSYKNPTGTPGGICTCTPGKIPNRTSEAISEAILR